MLWRKWDFNGILIQWLYGSLLFLKIGCLQGEPCSSLDGIWYNQVGEELYLIQGRGLIEGNYVSSRKERGGPVSHVVVGGAGHNISDGKSFGFGVLYGDGEGVKVWTGQCTTCGDGEEKLTTTWLHRTKTSSCDRKWRSTMIGQDVFTRRISPFRRKRHSNKARRKRTQWFSDDYFANQSEYRTTGTTVKPRRTCDLNGKWYNELGSEVIIVHGRNGIITGEYRTGVERKRGSAGASHGTVYGLGNPVEGGNSTFAFVVVWNNGTSVTGWTGQCYACHYGDFEVLETSWIMHTDQTHCSNQWKSNLYGSNSFTHIEQRSGPRRHMGIHLPIPEPKKSSHTSGCRPNGFILSQCVLGTLIYTFIVLISRYVDSTVMKIW